MSPRCPWGWLPALLSLLSAVPAVPGGPGGSLPLPVPDGRSRVQPATPGTLPELRRRFPVLALLRPRDRGNRPEELAALELVAQALEPSGVGLALVDTEKDPELAREWGLAGPSRLALLRGSAVTEYRGELGAAALLQFLSQALGPPVQVVAAGQQLRDFGDIEEEPKAIGYFEGRDSETFQAFSAAAQRFHPSLLFFATFDPQAAQELGLGLNQVDLYEPFLEQPRSFWGGPGDPPGIEEFLESTKRATLRKLKAQSESDSWERQDGIHVVAFAEGDDPDGFEFLEILREVAQEQRDNPDFSVLWIDPDDFPMLVPSWEDTFDIDLSRPQLGVVNGTDHARSVWLPMEDEDDLPGPEEVLEWLEAVLEGDTGDSDGDGDGDGEQGDEDDEGEDDDDNDNDDDGEDDEDDDDDNDDNEDDDDD